MLYNTYEIHDLSNSHVVNILKNGIQNNHDTIKNIYEQYGKKSNTYGQKPSEVDDSDMFDSIDDLPH